MESRHRIFLLATLLACTSALAETPQPVIHSEAVIQPEVQRSEIELAVIDTEDFAVGLYAGVMSVEDFGSNLVYGLRLDYLITEDLFVEAAIGQTETEKTSYETLSGGAELLSGDERMFRYGALSLGYNLLPGESFIGSNHAFNSALYINAGIGAVQFADDTRFSLNAGAGYRLLPIDGLALHVDVRDHLFSTDLLGEKKITNNIELHAGFSVLF
ncbi:outer membrane beta-barrel domain-containing protein [Solemya pervernicosa gill symbiont]|uniref:Outer membrane beta-barrel domain-containing protein n=1 Tax=Solemya pervernicosa gill symbiont TaxID=642797 RepID=A0A1T2L355_9GAMM|nr:outer membrane beta-barrel domain-containing protein [Solemya pervernicosa gill symbiont]OOZ39535.1 outer membrane beta-barrel domain-containing protein [Solemya pervernicosa gill symbiont]